MRGGDILTRVTQHRARMSRRGEQCNWTYRLGNGQCNDHPGSNEG